MNIFINENIPDLWYNSIDLLLMYIYNLAAVHNILLHALILLNYPAAKSIILHKT